MGPRRAGLLDTCTPPRAVRESGERESGTPARTEGPLSAPWAACRPARSAGATGGPTAIPPGRVMSSPSPDPAKWLRDLMQTEPAALWPAVNIADTGKQVAAVAAPWTKAVADFTAMQLTAVQQMTAPWTAALPGLGAAAEPVKDRRFAGEEWTKDPRYEAVVRTYLTQSDLLHKALDAAPLDEHSKA